MTEKSIFDTTDLEKGCGSSFYGKGNVTQICGWKKGINRITGVLLCPECEKIYNERQRLKLLVEPKIAELELEKNTLKKAEVEERINVEIAGKCETLCLDEIIRTKF